VRPVTGSRAHDPKRLPSSQLLRARTPLVSKPPTPHPRAFESRPRPTPRDPRAFARRPSVIRRLGDGGMCALHRFTRSRRTATVRGVSAKLLQARSRVPGVPSGYRAPRPRCIRPTSTHPSSRPREPASSCDPSVDTRLAPPHSQTHPAGLEAPWDVSPFFEHRCSRNRETCTGRLGPADAGDRGNACFTTRISLRATAAHALELC